MKQTRIQLAAFGLLLVSTVLLAAVEGNAGGLRWTVPLRWGVAGPKPMRAFTYTIPSAPGTEAAECAVFYFGQGQGGGVDENLQRWAGQFEASGPPKKSERTVAGFKVHMIDLSGTYLSPAGPMMQSQGKKPGWRLLGAIVESPDGLVFFKCVGPAAAIQKAEKELDELLKSLVKAGAAKV